MRVLFLVKTAHGAQWAVEQAQELVRQGVHVHVTLPGPGPMVAAWTAVGVQVHLLAPGLTSLPRLRRLVDAVRPDLVHSHFVATTLWMRMALQGHPVPRLFQVPGPLHLEHAGPRAAELRSAGTRDWWAASCLWTRDAYLAAGLPEDRVGLVYYGRDLEKLQPAPPGRLRAELGLDADARIVGMVAHIYGPRPWLGQRRGIKGHEDLIEALAQIPGAVGVFAGGPWGRSHRYAASLSALARERLGPRAHFLGHREDVTALYADFDVAVHPSLSENLGGAAESLALAVPTVATWVGGLPDLVHPGSTGWLVPPADPEGLAVAIREVLADRVEARRRALAGQRLATTLLDVRATVSDLRMLYERITG